MKCITVCEPFASALLFGGKDVENRKHRLGISGITLIHAGQSLDWFTPQALGYLHERWPACPFYLLQALHLFRPRMGKIIGAVEFGEPYDFDPSKPTGPEFDPASRWATGPVCHPVLDREPFAEPFPWRGYQGAYIVPASAIPEPAMAAIERVEARAHARDRTG